MQGALAKEAAARVSSAAVAATTDAAAAPPSLQQQQQQQEQRAVAESPDASAPVWSRTSSDPQAALIRELALAQVEKSTVERTLADTRARLREAETAVREARARDEARESEADRARLDVDADGADAGAGGVTIGDLQRRMRELRDNAVLAKQCVAEDLLRDSAENAALRAQNADLEEQLALSCDDNAGLRETNARLEASLKTLRGKYDARFRETATHAADIRELVAHMGAIAAAQGDIQLIIAQRRTVRTPAAAGSDGGGGGGGGSSGEDSD